MYLLLLLLSYIIGVCNPICVLDNKKGWWLDCGLRDSYLFRIKDFGGITARFDFALGVGDESGFPHSIGNTNKFAKTPHPQPGPPIIPPFHGNKLYSRAGPGDRPSIRPPTRYGQEHRPSVERRAHRQQQQQVRMPPWASNERRPPHPRGRRPFPHPPPPPFSPQHNPSNPPAIIPAKGHRGVWVRLPVQQVLKDGRPSGYKYIDPATFNYQGFNPNGPLSNLIRERHPYGDGDQVRLHGHTYQMMDKSRIPGMYSLERFSDDGILEEEEREQDGGNHLFLSSEMHEPPLLTDKPTNTHFSAFRSPPPLPADQQLPSQPGPFQELPKNLPEPYQGPVVGTVLGEVLQLPPTTPADSDHVPSFAAQLLVVRDAPINMHPPGYNNTAMRHYTMMTKLPRTKFFCEEQEFLPGLYADVQLGCKIFHLCVPAPLGSTIQSFLCPNSTLFDQSILQCNYWELVDCSQSSDHYDANQPLALSYRRVNAAYLPVDNVHDPLTLSLLGDIRER